MKLSLKISEILKSISASHRNISVRSRGRRTRVETAGQILEPRTLLTTIDLAALIAGQGTTIFGADEVDNSGFSVSSAGDVNGDGFDDLIIGAPSADASGNAKNGAGESYLIFGDVSLPTTIDLANLGSRGITIFGAEANDESGNAVSNAGDVNGDGFGDLLIGAYSASSSGEFRPGAGKSYLIFGKANWSATPTIDLNTLGTAGITILGAGLLDSCGSSVSSAGDVNGDGLDDMLIGADGADGVDDARFDSGESYVIFGKANWSATPSIDLQNLGSAGITIFGAEAGDSADISDSWVSSAGDVNGDGFDELLIGAFRANGVDGGRLDSGESYMIFGKADWSTTMTIDLGSLGSAGVTIFGAEANDNSGRSVSSAGDVNGDGFDDLLIGADGSGGSGNAKSGAGESYVIFGKADWTPAINLTNLGAAGITIFGADAGDVSGRSVSSAGDVNGDGFDDILIGAFQADSWTNTDLNAGDSYLIFGKANWSATPMIDLLGLGSAGITFFGADAGDRSGRWVSNSGDVNGDGFSDLLIGAGSAAALGNAKNIAGETYVIFGGNNFTGSILAANLGSSAANTITGTTASNLLNGAGGNDALVGAGGADVLIGGHGNDTLAVSDATFRRIVGGTGTDTLRLDGSGLNLNLTMIADNRLLDVEQIDITGSGNNMLTLNQREVLNLSSSSNTLTVIGNTNDQLVAGSGWTRGADQSGFKIFTQGAATLKVSDAVTVLNTIDLAAVGIVGVTIFGADAGDNSGTSVSNAGDVNGDGFEDILIGASSADASGNAKSKSGDSYLIFGRSSWSTTPTIDLGNLGSAGITFLGAEANDYSGRSVSSAGDVNGDGFADLLIGADRADSSGNARADAGESYLIFGKANWIGMQTIDLSNLGTSGVSILGSEELDRSGFSVSNAGDVNGDGFDDMLIGAYRADASGNATSRAGDSYVVFGKANWSGTSTIDLSNLGTAGVTIYGVDSSDESGRSLSSAGDVNGDGFDDLLIGATGGDASGNAKSFAGDSYLVFGKASMPTTIDLASLSTAGITFFGAGSYDFSGRSVSSAGDVNGDGFDDLLIGAYNADGAGDMTSDAGDSYLIFGKANWSATPTIDLSNPGSGVITIFGADRLDQSGRSVSSAGDVNGDGFDDLLIGANLADSSNNARTDSGDSYVVFGKADWSGTPSIDLAKLGQSGQATGITIFGADADDYSGRSVSSAGDVNGDGFDDLLIGAHYANASGNAKDDAGESYVIFGGNNFTSSILAANLGTSTANTITGTSAANLLNGAGGNDTLVGAGGADVLIGGQGNDTLAVSDATFRRIDGGTGTDTVRLDGSGLHLNLTTIADNRFVDIEQIDITGSGNNTLTLNLREVLSISSRSNTLTVIGYVGDSVQFGPGWTQVAQEFGYMIFKQGAATLQVSESVTVSAHAKPLLDLATLGMGGVTIFGADVDDVSGLSVSNAGDVNGDGYDDVLIGASFADAAENAKSLAGDSYVVFGGPSLPTTIDLGNLGVAGMTIFGADAGDRSGISVSSAGDVNGDGFDDLLIGAYLADASFNETSYAGDSYVIFGRASLPAAIDLASLGSAGVTIFGAAVQDRSGRSVSSAGDVNGDGFDDLLIGARYGDFGGNARLSAGNSYVIFGKASLPATISLNSLGTDGITIHGAETNDSSGISVSSAGDVNGDGFDDLLVGASAADASGNSKSSAGDTYVIFGKALPPAAIDLANLGAAGITIFGADANDLSGGSVSRAGDVNGDGFDDLLIGARGGDAAGNAKSYVGESYVIFGSASLPTTINLATLGTAGITIFGADVNDGSGGAVSSAGDVNGDGFDDLLIGASSAGASGNVKILAGDSCLIFGGTSLPTTIDLATLPTVANAGITIFGAAPEDFSGRSVSSAGDVNGDSFDDLLIGASGGDALDNAKSSAGDSYVIFGGDFTASVTHPGTSVGETLTGTAVANVMTGGRGNDTLIGGGGADVLIGGQGSDVLAVSDLTFRRLVGGTGIDTLRLDGNGRSLNLTTLRDNRLLGIERIDITGSGDNSLTLSYRDVLNVSDESNTLIVTRNAGDVVSFGTGWIQGRNERVGPATYEVFTQGQAILKIQTTSPQPIIIDLAALTAAEGTTIFGADSNDNSGVSVSNAGDVNGDGFEDLLIGAYHADAAGNVKSNAGDTYLIFGSASLPPTIDLANLGTAGITISGVDSNDYSGTSVSSAGDMNGDGFDDLIIGAHTADGSGNTKALAGESYVIFGRASLPTTINLATLGTAGITIFGADASDQSGFSVSSAGDVNGDGFDDVLIGAYNGDAVGNAKLSAGETYVIFGRASLPTTINLASLGTAGITIFGADAGDASGFSVGSAGDVNGDGFVDLLIGAVGASAAGNAKSAAGDSYVIFGRASFPTTIDLASLGTAGLTILGADAGDNSGNSVSSAGDVNGDGFDDLVIGASSADAAGNAKLGAGDCYVIFGKASLPTIIDLASLGTAGITIFGADAGDINGRSVSSAGDINGDGFDDLLISAQLADAASNAKSQAGECYVIFGSASLPTTIDLANLGTAGITIRGAEASDTSGRSVSNAGDVNGDGFDDLLIGARFADASGNTKSYAGDSYVIFGSDFSASVTEAGTSVGETLTGTSAASIMIGDRGNDNLFGNGGADVLRGGQGNDVLVVSSTTFKRIVGGTGSDTLKLDGTGLSLNLTTLRDNRIVDVEMINITGSGNNTLTLNLREVLNISSESNRLLVRRNVGDVVNIGLGWTQGADQILGGVTYHILTQGAATLGIEVTRAGGLVQLLGSTLTVTGSALADVVSVSAATNVTVTLNGVGRDFAPTLVTAIVVNGQNGDDTITVNSLRTGNTFTANGGNGNDIMTVSSAVSIGVILNGDADNDTLTGGSGDDQLTGNAGNDLLIGGPGSDKYLFGIASVGEADQITENSNEGIDTLNFSALTTNVTLHLGATTVQTVHTNRTLKLNSGSTIENTIGGSGADNLAGNGLGNTLTGGAGDDRLNGTAGNDLLIGGLNNDTYLFTAASAAEADQVTENSNEGVDTLNFSALTTNVTLHLGATTVQTVHTNRTLKLNLGSTIENTIGGSGADNLAGNGLANTLTGGAGDDRLNGAAGNDLLIGGLNNDTYLFTAASAAEADQVMENSNEGIDTLNFSALTTNVTLHLGATTVQTVHTNRTLKLNLGSTIENTIGGSGADNLAGNGLANTLTGGAGDDRLNGAAGNDLLIGGLNNDTYLFTAASAAEADQVTENPNEGVDTLNFTALATNVVLNLGSTAIQTVHANRSLKLNSVSTFENAVGGTGSDTLLGNALANRLTGGNGDNILVGLEGGDILEAGSGRDILIGGLGLDSLNGGLGEDILIAGRTTSDTSLTNLNTFRTQWISSNTYAVRVANLRAGVGNPVTSLKARTNVLNDAGEDDSLTGGGNSDWFFRAVDDVITDLLTGESLDLL